MPSALPRAVLAIARVGLAAFSGLLLGVALARPDVREGTAALGLLVAMGFVSRERTPWFSVIAGMAAANALMTSQPVTAAIALLLTGISTDLLTIYSRWLSAELPRPRTIRQL